MASGAAVMTGFRWISALGLGFSLVACSGRVDVGFEPVNEGGGASTGATGSGGTKASAGSSSVGQAGQGVAAGAAPGSGGSAVCDFGPTAVAQDPRPLLSSEQVLARLFQFLNDDPTLPAGPLPPEPTASWAAARAKAVLDQHVAEETAAPGLERFLTNWLGISDPAVELQSPGRFARELVAADATLATLLAEPTGEHRFGILNDPEFLSHYPGISRRGAFINVSLLCREIPAPPPDVPQIAWGSEGTQRQRHEAAVSPLPCSGCHRLMDPPGDSLEHFDEAGNYRELDNGLPVNAASSMSEPPMTFADFSELAPQLATSCAVGHCFTRMLGNEAFGRHARDFEVPLTEQELNRAALAFAESGYSIRVLVDSIVRSPSFLR